MCVWIEWGYGGHGPVTACTFNFEQCSEPSSSLAVDGEVVWSV